MSTYATLLWTFPIDASLDLDYQFWTVKRTVLLVAEEPVLRNGKARLYAFGVRAIAAAGGVSEKTVRRAIVNGTLNPSSLGCVLRFLTERENHERPSKSGQAARNGKDGRPTNGSV